MEELAVAFLFFTPHELMCFDAKLSNKSLNLKSSSFQKNRIKLTTSLIGVPKMLKKIITEM